MESRVNYSTDAFNDLKSFDVVSIDEIVSRHNKIQKLLNSNFNSSNIVNKRIARKVETEGDRIFFERYKGRKNLYLELPYEFFNEYLIGWGDDICTLGLDIEESPLKKYGDCFDCKIKNNFLDSSTLHLSWKFIKQKILNNEKWEHDDEFRPQTYELFESFKNYGLVRPIYNKSINSWLINGTHRVAFCSILKSDVPFFLPLKSDSIENDRYVFTGAHPYFKGKKYCTLVVLPKLKKVEFYLSSYWSSFDENRDKKIREVIYNENI
jgi:hypothetical protein